MISLAVKGCQAISTAGPRHGSALAETAPAGKNADRSALSKSLEGQFSRLDIVLDAIIRLGEIGRQEVTAGFWSLA